MPDEARFKRLALSAHFLPFVFFPVVHLQLRCRSETLCVFAKGTDLRDILLRKFRSKGGRGELPWAPGV